MLLDLNQTKRRKAIVVQDRCLRYQMQTRFNGRGWSRIFCSCGPGSSHGHGARLASVHSDWFEIDEGKSSKPLIHLQRPKLAGMRIRRTGKECKVRLNYARALEDKIERNKVLITCGVPRYRLWRCNYLWSSKNNIIKEYSLCDSYLLIVRSGRLYERIWWCAV